MLLTLTGVVFKGIHEPKPTSFSSPSLEMPDVGGEVPRIDDHSSWCGSIVIKLEPELEKHESARHPSRILPRYQNQRCRTPSSVTTSAVIIAVAYRRADPRAIGEAHPNGHHPTCCSTRIRGRGRQQAPASQK